MNKANAIALINTGVLSVNRMLNLCMASSRNDQKINQKGYLDVVHEFINVWTAANPTSGTKDLIDVVAGNYIAEEGVVLIGSELWDREDFDYAFKKFTVRYLLLSAAASSGKYNQQEVFDFAEQYQEYYSQDHMPGFWTPVVNANILDADGLFKIATLDTKRVEEMEKLCLLIISKKLLDASQLLDVCAKYGGVKRIDFAAISTGTLSDTQVIKLMSKGDHDWRRVIKHLQLQDRFVDSLIPFGEEADSLALWQAITETVKENIATGCLSDDEIMTIMSNCNLGCKWTDAILYLRLGDRTTEDLIAFGDKVDSDLLWPAIVHAINQKKV